MSSARRTDRRRGGWTSGWTLRRRLVVGVVALLTVVCAVIGVTAELVVTRTLQSQLDSQLKQADNRAQSIPPQNGDNGGAGGPGGGHRPDLNPNCSTTSEALAGVVPPGLGPRSVGARIEESGLVTAAVMDRTVCPVALTEKIGEMLAGVRTDHQPHTLTLPGPNLGDYRVIASKTSSGVVLVTGLPLGDVDSALNSINLVLLIVAGAGLVAAAVAGAIIIRGNLRPLDRVAATATKVVELPLDRGEVVLPMRVPDEDTDPRTEVGKVGAALNRMLGHVSSALNVRQESETRVRQFVADASHELRTPLASIRGYAELAARYREQVPPDVSHAMRRIQSESTRMTSLVEELLLLARLDAGRPLAREPVDLSLLVVDAVADARVAGKDHRWQLEMPGEPVFVLGDHQALHQVLVNLLGNARAHTPPGTTVTTGIRHGNPGEIVLGVIDNGPGIPAQLQSDVFERFTRGDSSRSRTSGGTGLGLSIVAAIVEAHGGDVHLASRPGRTVFTVRLTAAA